MPLIDMSAGTVQGGVRTPFTRNPSAPLFGPSFVQPHPNIDLVRAAYASLLGKTKTPPTAQSTAPTPFGTTKADMAASAQRQRTAAELKKQQIEQERLRALRAAQSQNGTGYWDVNNNWHNQTNPSTFVGPPAPPPPLVKPKPKPTPTKPGPSGYDLSREAVRRVFYPDIPFHDSDPAKFYSP